MATVGELNIQMSLDTKLFKSQLTSAKQSITQFANEAKKLGAAFDFSSLGAGTSQATQSLAVLANQADEIKGSVPALVKGFNALAVSLGKVATKSDAAAINFQKFVTAFKDLPAGSVDRMANAAAAAGIGLEQVGKQAKRTSGATQSLDESSKQSSYALLNLGRTLEDGAFAFQDFRLGVIAVSNNLAPLAESMARTGVAARAAGQTVEEALVASLTGPGGVVFAVSLVSAALIAIPAIFKKFSKEVEESTDSVKEFQAALVSLKDGPKTAELTLAEMAMGLKRLKEEATDVQDLVDALTVASRTGGSLTGATGDDLADANRKLNIFNKQLEETNASVKSIGDDLSEGVRKTAAEQENWTTFVEYRSRIEKEILGDLESQVDALETESIFSEEIKEEESDRLGLIAKRIAAEIKAAEELRKQKELINGILESYKSLAAERGGEFFKVGAELETIQDALDFQKPLSELDEMTKRVRELFMILREAPDPEDDDSFKTLSEVMAANWEGLYDVAIIGGLNRVSDAIAQATFDLLTFENVFESLAKTAHQAFASILADMAKFAAFEGIKELLGFIPGGTLIGGIVGKVFGSYFGLDTQAGSSSGGGEKRLVSTRVSSGDIAFSLQRNAYLSSRSGVSTP
jgi:hypothetical protein